MTAPAAISFAGIGHVFRRDRQETRALAGIDLDIAAGEFVAVVGPSGCGKSTLLRVAAGLLAPSAGEARMLGRAVTAPVTELGVVFQSPVLMDWLDVLGNVLAQIDLRGRDVAPWRAPARALLSAVGLAGFEDRYPHELSGGMRQRVASVRALIHDPPVLLMDEPFGALDALTREQMRIDLEALWLARRKTVLFITHSIDEAVLLADRVVVMTPRPGAIDRVMAVDLPRPRNKAVQASDRFAHYVEEITECFMAHGVIRY